MGHSSAGDGSPHDEESGVFNEAGSHAERITVLSFRLQKSLKQTRATSHVYIEA